MRIVVDMQGAQSESRYRGIGRYALSLITALVEDGKGHEIILAVNGAFPDSVLSIRRRFARNLPSRQIRVWTPVAPTREDQEGNQWRRQASEILFQSFIDSLKPDIFLTCSLFEGFSDDAVTIIPPGDRPYLRSVIVYDLIPHNFPAQYLDSSPPYKEFYYRKFNQIPSADLLLTISDYSRKEIIENLGVDHSKVANIQAGIEAIFHQSLQHEKQPTSFSTRLNIDNPFILYVGGSDFRKNLRSLVEAYARLPERLIKKHKLVFAGQIHNAAELTEEGVKLGLPEDSMTFLSHVRDSDLVHLYNCCELMVCPSLHEGFGLTVLEAMACGAPVICSDTSALPEVVGDESAMFDPLDIDQIAATIERALTDRRWRQKTRTINLDKAKNFTWQNSVQRLVEAIESGPKDSFVDGACSHDDLISRATISELINDIALLDDTDGCLSADAKKLAQCIASNHPSRKLQRILFVDISELRQRDAGTGIQRVTRSILQQLLTNPPIGYRVQPVYATTDSVGFRLANEFTHGFLGLQGSPEKDREMRCEEGDIFLGLDLSHQPIKVHEAWLSDMASNGLQVWFVIYDLLPIQFPHFWGPQHDLKALHEDWLRIVTQFRGVLCISNTVADDLKDWLKHAYPEHLADLAVESFQLGAEMGCSRTGVADEDHDTELLAALQERPTFLMVGTLEPRKGHAQVLDAAELMWRRGLDFNLVIVGHKGWLVEGLVDRLDNHDEVGMRLFLLHGISDAYLEKIYRSSSCLVAASYGEGFGLPLIEAAKRELPIICRDISVFREVAGEHAFYFSDGDGEGLAERLAEWLGLFSANEHIKSINLPWVTWRTSASQVCGVLTKYELPRRQLLVDVSELVTQNAGTDIQRVAKNILNALMATPPEGYAVRAVYATPQQTYRYANSFVSNFDTSTRGTLFGSDEFVEPAPDDIFLCLDLQPQKQITRRDYFSELRVKGVCTCFLVYDLLPVTLPGCFPEGSSEDFQAWLTMVSEADKVVCISHNVAEQFTNWLELHGCSSSSNPSVSWVHSGGDFLAPKDTHRHDAVRGELVLANPNSVSFLVVGTIEPRKNVAQILEAFDILWRDGSDVSLTVVGQEGWLCEELTERLENHPERGKRLIRKKSVTDRELAQLYTDSNCLIAASRGEGFSLPLIEASRFALPIIARDLPVFKEVAGENAFYFRGETAQALADAIKGWLDAYGQGEVPDSGSIKALSWAESTANLVAHLIEECNGIDKPAGISD